MAKRHVKLLNIGTGCKAEGIGTLELEVYIFILVFIEWT